METAFLNGPTLTKSMEAVNHEMVHKILFISTGTFDSGPVILTLMASNERDRGG